MTQITLTSFGDATGTKVAKGTACAVPTDQNDVITPFRINLFGQAEAKTICVPLVNGAIVGTLQLANPAITHPSGISYRFTLTDTDSQQITKYKAVNIGAGTFSLDGYDPSLNNPNVAQVLIVGPIGQTGDAGPAGTAGPAGPEGPMAQSLLLSVNGVSLGTVVHLTVNGS